MLPPSPMLTIKNRGGSDLAGGRESNTLISSNVCKLVLLLALLAGCTPPGPRALLDGKRLIDERKYPQAIEKLTAAISLLGGTNALAWNYLGMAYQHADRVPEAERAYQRALGLNPGLSEARFNLGCLWLAQNKLEAAKTEFTAFTLGRQNEVQGFLKLGAVQLRTREPSAAELSFSEALRLSPHNAEAWNGLGLARLQRGGASEAAQCFDNALKQQPDYRPALLNLAIVSHQYLKDRQFALEKYREYLALKPTPANADALSATVRQLEQELSPPPRHPATNAIAQLKPNAIPPKPSATTQPKPAATNVTRTASAPRSELAANAPRPPATNLPKPEAVASGLKPAATNPPKPTRAVATAPPAKVEVAKLPAELVLKQAQDAPTVQAPAHASSAEPLVTTSSVPASATGPKVAKRGFFQRLFGGGEQAPPRPTPLGSPARPPQSELTKTATTGAELAAASAPAPAPQDTSGPYAYKSPPRPSPGNRSEAERSFAQGVKAQREHRLPEAIQAYRLAARLDPSLFEAQYNLGLTASEAGNLSLAMTAYENALAIQPTSLDARYNFALVLKQANYLTNAVNELERVLASYPNETRAHLALGNLYAQQLGQPAKARQHYRKVLEVEPRHPQAGAIRYWLAANPP
jgi:Flp pilus assembly protein TadD